MIDQFWIDLEAAYNKVAANNEFSISIERNGKKANVKAVVFVEGEPSAIVVVITNIDTETKQPFIVP